MIQSISYFTVDKEVYVLPGARPASSMTRTPSRGGFLTFNMTKNKESSLSMKR